ncbi:MAG TPA: hypothetical protein IAC75_06705 [Candidatus Spyradosoma merdigallinarum]|uniref:Uncharacterized protein n=1 Tax=Candidatus Spyradosoma merdigallinarum TaxID=2840950 RepID=A0A9D1NKH0_9BACT|nr:hypothetical protein [Candidatus Spyradosoma merdigallinarum]
MKMNSAMSEKPRCRAAPRIALLTVLAGELAVPVAVEQAGTPRRMRVFDGAFFVEENPRSAQVF